MNDRKRANFDLDQLLHPAQAFGHPSEIISDPDLTLNEKRAILASWASDACAVEAAPELRRSPDGPVVLFDDIMDALRALAAQFAATSAKMRATRRRSVLDRLRSSGGDRDAQLN
jgi:hypothetical protein